MKRLIIHLEGTTPKVAIEALARTLECHKHVLRVEVDLNAPEAPGSGPLADPASLTINERSRNYLQVRGLPQILGALSDQQASMARVLLKGEVYRSSWDLLKGCQEHEPIDWNGQSQNAARKVYSALRREIAKSPYADQYQLLEGGNYGFRFYLPGASG